MSSKSKPSLVYYVHHHGSGHRSRFTLLMPELIKKFELTVIVASIEQATTLKSDKYEVLVMPTKWPATESANFKHTFTAAFEGVLHFQAAAKRSHWFSRLLLCMQPCAFISDGSAELAIMARSMGTYVVLMRMNGNYQQDPTQVFAHESADTIIAPYPQRIEDEGYEYGSKTIYNGLFSKYQTNAATRSNSRTITLLLGYDNMPESTIRAITSVPDYSFEIIGNKTTINNLKHVKQYGRVKDISACITGDIVISAAGHNSIAELITLNKRLVLVPEKRPYNEQLYKATSMEREGYVVRAQENFTTQDWARAIAQAQQIDNEQLQGLLDVHAPARIAAELERLYA